MIVAKLPIGDIDVSIIKKHHGHEGEELHEIIVSIDNNPVLIYTEGDWGSESNILVKNEEFFRKLKEFVLTLPEIDLTIGFSDTEPLFEKMTIEILISELLTRALIYQEFNKKGEATVLFSLPEHAKGEYSTVKINNGTMDKAIEFVKGKHPNAVIWQENELGFMNNVLRDYLASS